MARLARVVIPGCPHHITHRGSQGQEIFFTVGDREQYCSWLRDYSDRYGLSVWSYCLMTNHIHLIAVPRDGHSLSRAVGYTHRRFSRLINRRSGWTGHVWANRFYSSPMDERHLWAAVRYVELNPVRAGLAENPIDYRWSSARAHCGLAIDPLLSTARPFPGPIRDWCAWLLDHQDAELIADIRERTSTGRPCGSDRFVRRVEAQLDRRLRPSRPGRRRSGKVSPDL